MCEAANVPQGSCGLPAVYRFRNASGYQVVVLDFQSRNSVIFEGPPAAKRILLYKKFDHFNVIIPHKVPAFFGKRLYCNKCKIYYNNFTTHSCNDACKTCLNKTSQFSFACGFDCPDCMKFCRSDECFERHKKARHRKGEPLPTKCERLVHVNKFVWPINFTNHMCNRYHTNGQQRKCKF